MNSMFGFLLKFEYRQSSTSQVLGTVQSLTWIIFYASFISHTSCGLTILNEYKNEKMKL